MHSPYHTLRRFTEAFLTVSLLAYYAIDVTYLLSSRGPPAEAETRWTATYNSLSNRPLYLRPMVKELQVPDVTAVILNWSRLPNVIQLTKTMCHSLGDVLAEIFIWNNNPLSLALEDFSGTGCPHGVLKIHNSPENVYFQARFLACSRAKTQYCFIQDDDYFIRPSIIRAMRLRMPETQSTSLHLLPPHEMLYSQLSRIQVGSVVNTLFAWLGYGAMMERSQAQDFLNLLQTVGVTDDVFKMADNYYTILSNRIPELWFDQNRELGGGTPFTVGSLGEERNNRHIANAGGILDNLTRIFVEENKIYPYISLPAPMEPESRPSRAACFDDPYVFETNINLLPRIQESVASASDIITHVAKQFNRFSTETVEQYLRFSPSFAVDGNPVTKFQSVGNALEGEWFSLSWSTADLDKNNLELAALIDGPTEVILQHCRFEISVHGNSWIALIGEPKCSAVEGVDLQECSLAFDRGSFRRVRVILETSLPHKWSVHEVWLRQKLE